jgi:hypothetical protein
VIALTKTSKLRKIILGIAIAIMLAFFLGYAVYLFYDNPDMEDFCEGINPRIDIDSCEGYDVSPVANGRPIPMEKDCYCNQVDKNGTTECTSSNPEYKECWEDYDESREKHERVSFIVLIVLGLASILVGGLVLKVESVGTGIMGGGVLTIIYAAMRYWGSIQDYGRLAILGVTLVVLIWIGYKKLKD